MSGIANKSNTPFIPRSWVRPRISNTRQSRVQPKIIPLSHWIRISGRSSEWKGCLKNNPGSTRVGTPGQRTRVIFFSPFHTEAWPRILWTIYGDELQYKAQPIYQSGAIFFNVTLPLYVCLTVITNHCSFQNCSLRPPCKKITRLHRLLMFWAFVVLLDWVRHF